MKLVPGALTLADLRAFAAERSSVVLDPSTLARLDKGAEAVRRIVAEGKPVYGINTGFGKLAQTHIADDQLELLQKNLVLSHSVGVGALLDDDVVRLVMLLKVASLACGYSGVRAAVVDAILALLERAIYPCIPSKGSVGASGDLAPLAHLSAALMGFGEVRRAGKVMPAADALAQAGLAPLRLGPKEGLALLNGTQVSTALALRGLFAAEKPALAIAEIGALSERRIALLIDAPLSGLPPFLTSASGVNSGFMIAHVTAAALASENKSLAHPASVDSLPTSANQEDHVSMATFAARRLGDMAENSAGIVAIELLAAAQGIDFRRPLKSSQALERAHAIIRAVAPHLDGDRHLGLDNEAVTPLVKNGTFVAFCPNLL